MKGTTGIGGGWDLDDIRRILDAVIRAALQSPFPSVRARAMLWREVIEPTKLSLTADMSAFERGATEAAQLQALEKLGLTILNMIAQE